MTGSVRSTGGPCSARQHGEGKLRQARTGVGETIWDGTLEQCLQGQVQHPLEEKSEAS